jgi:thiamine-phosphate pyrophosphorylase
MVRHQVKEGIEGLRINRQELLIARDASGDVGASAYVKDELQRSDIKEVLKVNFRRTEEALRVLEEFTKLLKPLSSLVFKKLRFKVYSLEKQMFTSSSLS